MGEPIDPIAYDVIELRGLVRGLGGGGSIPDEPPASLAPLGATVEYDRPSSWTGSLEERQKPYLRRLPDGERARATAREWIEGLVERGGSGGAAEALAYYESIGWLTEAAREELAEHLPTTGACSTGSFEDLAREDHLRSLARTAALAASDPTDGDVPGSAPGGRAAAHPTDRGIGTALATSDGGRGVHRETPVPQRKEDVGPDPGTLTVDLPEDLAAPDGAPYLRSLERGYAVDALVLRWIAMLAERGGPAAALDAIHRYETFGWITADVRDDLREYLSAPGLEDGRVDVDAARLAVEDHVASFRFVLALAVLERRRGEY